MNKDNLYRIFNHTECILTEKMIEYQEGKLPEKEKNAVEIHLSSCNMCHDEFEGLTMISNKKALVTTVFDLNKKVDEVLAKTNRKIPFLMPINLMAAIILFLIGFAWYATYYINSINQKKMEIAQAVDENSFKTDGEILILRPESSLSESERNLEMARTLKEKEISESEETMTGLVSKEKKSEIALNDDNLNKNNVTDSVNIEDLNISKAIEENKLSEELKTEKGKNIVAREEIIENELSKKDILDETDDSNVAGNSKDIAVVSTENDRKEKNITEENRSKSKISGSLKTDQFTLGMAEFNQKNYQSAINSFKQSIQIHKPVDEVYFYLALSYENSGLFQDALGNYNQLIANKKSKFYEEALWNKSRILVILNKKKSSLNTLNQIIELKGKYLKQAEAVRDSLNLK